MTLKPSGHQLCPATGSPGSPAGSQADRGQTLGQRGRRYLIMSHFHCSPSGQKLLTPSRYRSALCSVSAHTTLFRAVTWDSGYGQSIFTALAQGRSTLRPAREKHTRPPKTRHQDLTAHFQSAVHLLSFFATFFHSKCSLFSRSSQQNMVKLCLNSTSV